MSKIMRLPSNIVQAQNPTPTLNAMIEKAQGLKPDEERFDVSNSWGSLCPYEKCVYYENHKIPIYVKWGKDIDACLTYIENQLLHEVRILHTKITRDADGYLIYPRYTQFLGFYTFTLPHPHVAVSWLMRYTYDENGEIVGGTK